MILENDNAIAATLCGSFPMAEQYKACPHDWMPITGEGGRPLWICRKCAGETFTLPEPHPALTHSPLSAAFEQAERELGARIGWPALVYQKIERPADQDVTIAQLRAELQRVNDRLGWIRINLDDARQHVGALLKELGTAIAWIEERGQPSEVYAPTADEIVPQLEQAYRAARAWLRK